MRFGNPCHDELRIRGVPRRPGLAFPLRIMSSQSVLRGSTGPSCPIAVELLGRLIKHGQMSQAIAGL